MPQGHPGARASIHPAFRGAVIYILGRLGSKEVSMKLNHDQKVFIVLASLVVVGLLLFPPWIRSYHTNAYTGYAHVVSERIGLQFIFQCEAGAWGASMSLDIITLLLELLAVAVVAGLCCWGSADKTPGLSKTHGAERAEPVGSREPN